MKIHTPLIELRDQLINLIAEGYGIVNKAYYFGNEQEITKLCQEWSNKTVQYLDAVFPTKKESFQFIYCPIPNYFYRPQYPYSPPNQTVQEYLKKANAQIDVLESILDRLTSRYEFEIESKRLYIQAIDSFSKVRDLNIDQVEPFLTDGFLDEPEEVIKKALLHIIGESFVPKDWPGETEDIYTARVLLNGDRVQTSMILKGSGTIRGRETQPADLGKNGDQLQRMFSVPSSRLFIIQSVKPIAKSIVDTTETYIDQLRARGNHCNYCIIDGQDTAMILYAYGFIGRDAH